VSRRTAWQCASLLLDYPDEGLAGRLPAIRSAAATLPDRMSVPLSRFVDHLVDSDLAEAQAAYVDTFDDRRRCNLFLTYFAHGDTRKRGMALLRFKQAYLAAGAVPVDSELPDHLSVVLEFAATVDPDVGGQLLEDHRAGLEVLRLSLRELGSPYAAVLEAVCATLSPLRGDEWEAVRRLAAEGPPEEEVGLTPYATPGFDAVLTDRRVDLPMPTVRGA